MMENEHSLGLVSERSGSQYDGGESSFEMSRVEEDSNGRRVLDWFQLKSPLPEINRTAQQHFNNRSAEHHSHTSGNNNQNNTSESNMSYKERSFLSPGIEREFSEIDQFLKETYEKYGIYELIKQFVEMEDQLVSTFEYLKRLQVIKNNRDEEGVKGHCVKGVSCFEEINEVDEFSFEAEENIIHEFLYNLQQFFVPQLTNNNDENDNNNTENKFTKKEEESSSSGVDYSFSAQKPFYENHSLNNNNNILINNNNFINTEKKNGHIHTSRSKHIILNANNNLLKSNKRNVFTDEKMIQSITLNNNNNNNLNHSIMPLRFDESIKMSSSLSIMNNNNTMNININKLHRQHEQSIKHTNSEIIGEEQESSIAEYSENYQQISNQEELLKTIFELRQEILTLKQQKYINKNGAYSSGESSFILDGSMVLGEQQQKYHFKHLNLGNINNFNSGRENNSSYCEYDDGEEHEERLNDSMLLDSSREHLGAMLGHNNNNSNNNSYCNYSNNNYPDKRPTIIATSLTKPLIISEDISNEEKESEEESYSASTFKLDMLESVQEEEHNMSIDKENDPNYDNVLLKYFSNEKKLFKDKESEKNVYIKKKPQEELLTEKFGIIVKTESEFISESLYPIKENVINSHFVKPKKQQTSRSETLSNFKTDTGIFIEKFFDDFKLFFKTEMEIQLILLSMIKKKKSIKPSIYREFNKMIEWYGDVKINRATRVESVEKFTYECLKLKGGILDDLKRYV